MLLMWN